MILIFSSTPEHYIFAITSIQCTGGREEFKRFLRSTVTSVLVEAELDWHVLSWYFELSRWQCWRLCLCLLMPDRTQFFPWEVVCRCWWVKLADRWRGWGRRCEGQGTPDVCTPGKFVLSHRELTTTPSKSRMEELGCCWLLQFWASNAPSSKMRQGSLKKKTKKTSLKTGLCFPYSRFPPGEAEWHI